MVIGQPWLSRTSVTEDKSGLGRWVEATLDGRDGRKLTIVCAYQVIKNTISKCGPYTAFAQQWHILRMMGKKQGPDPHKEFLTDLGNRVEALRKDKHEVIVLIDANDSLQTTNSALTNG